MTVGRPEDLIRPEILALSAYHVPPAAGMVKLDAMENPYRLPEALASEVGGLAASAPINRYPDPSAAALKDALREAMAVPTDASILLGNGSDEIIQIIAMALAKPGAAILSPEPSFVMYRMIAAFCGMRHVGVPLRPDYGLDLPAMLAAIERERPAVVFLAYPNNPTGNLFPAADVEAILRAAPGLVVVDEAYHAFAGHSFMGRLSEFPNLAVMRTLSKLGLAGLRLGFLCGAPAWADQFEKLRLPYNINVLTQTVALRVLQDVQVLNDQARRLIVARAKLIASLQSIPKVEAFPSDANFVLFRVPDAPRVFEGLKARGILVKSLHGSHPLLGHCLRVTVGAPEENAAFLAALEACLNG